MDKKRVNKIVEKYKDVPNNVLFERLKRKPEEDVLLYFVSNRNVQLMLDTPEKEVPKLVNEILEEGRKNAAIVKTAYENLELNTPYPLDMLEISLDLIKDAYVYELSDGYVTFKDTKLWK